MKWELLGYAFMLSALMVFLGYAAYNLGMTARVDTDKAKQ